MKLPLPGTGFSSLGTWFAASAALGCCLLVTSASAQPARSCAEIETFLRHSNLKPQGKRAVMDDGAMQHPVFLYTSDEASHPDRARDTWKATVAGYELAKMLQINIIPPYVEIQVDGRPAAVSWGLDGVMMDEGQLTQRKIQPPGGAAFDRQIDVVRVFDELLYNRHAPTDLVITKDWKAWVLAPGQAFLPNPTLRNPGNLARCDRKLLARMRTLDQSALTANLGAYLTGEEIQALYARAARIVEFFDREIASKGESVVLFDLDRSGSACAL